jgi:ankyrin repeat protein
VQTTFNLFFSFIFCLSLTLLNGCGGGGSAVNNKVSESASSDGESVSVDSGTETLLAELVPKVEQPSQDAPPVPHRQVPYQTPGKDIFEATLWGTIRDIEHHINNGADINAPQAGTGNTLLHFAITNHQVGVEIVHYLVSRGVDVNTQAKGGNTPLHVAAINPHADVEILRYLISNGADVNMRNDVGKTPLDFAAMNRYRSEEKQSIIRAEGGGPGR